MAPPRGLTFFHVEVELLAAIQGLRSESFVDFVHVNITGRDASFLACFRNGHSGSDAHDFWRAAGNGEGHKRAHDGEAELFGFAALHAKDSCGTVADLRRVASSGSSILLESRPELAQFFQSRALSGPVVLGNSDGGLFAFFIDDFCRDRDNFGEVTFLLGFEGLAVGFNSQGIHLCSGDAKFFSNVFRCLTHWNHTLLGKFIFEDRIWEVTNGPTHRSTCHGLKTSSDADIINSGFDGSSNIAEGLKTRRALAIDSHQRGGIGKSSNEAGHASLRCKCTRLKNVANNDVAHKRLVQTNFLARGFQSSSKKIRRQSVLERTFLGTADSRSYSRHDHNIVVRCSGVVGRHDLGHIRRGQMGKKTLSTMHLCMKE
mmetsp:Transcript_36420/g.71531  ORF Transcript_36420/g.71531 Transcript_36420/m.71531 type:complete len:373 (+) Transcript_36420:235-1353(+)